MITDLATVGQDATLTLIARILHERRISAVPVVADGVLVGVVSRTDLVRIGRIQAGTHRTAPVLKLPEQQASDLLRHAARAPLTVDATAMLRDAARTMCAEHVHRLFVTDGGKLAGVISTYDLMRAVRDARLEIPIAEIMSTPLFTINAQQPVGAAVARLESAHVSGLVVVDDDFPVGVFTQLEALEARDLPRDTRVDEVFDPAMLCLPANTKMFRAAEQACRMEARRVIPCRDREAVGIVTGLDFAKLVAAT
jgi:predicted transcriptional regulator